MAGLVSRRPPEALASYVRKHELGEGQIYRTIKEMAPHVDVIAIFAPNFARVEMVEEIVDAVKAGSPLKGVICEKPLARNLAEARRVVKLVEDAHLPHAYFENQLHMKSMQVHRVATRTDHASHGSADPDAFGRRTCRAAQSLVLGSNEARRRRDERHGLPLPGGRLVRADAAGQGRAISAAAKA